MAVSRYHFVLLCSFVLCFSLIMQHSWLPGLFHDGYLYAAASRNLLDGVGGPVPFLIDGTYERFDHHLPLSFYTQAIFYKVFGVNYPAMRFFSLFWVSLCLLPLIFERRRIGIFAPFFLISALPLIKKSRFPGVDIPLMGLLFLGLYSYTRAITGSSKHWPLLGIALGLASLVKGPLVAILVFTISIDLMIRYKLKAFIHLRTWMAYLMGLSIFSLWPLSLWLSGDFDIFIHYINFTFLHSIAEGRGQSAPFYTYIEFLLIYTPHLLLGFLAFFHPKLKKVMMCSHTRPYFLFVLVGLIILSAQSMKYSNYLLPLYPALAVCLSAVTKLSSEKVKSLLTKSIGVLALVVPLLLLSMPITQKISRDPFLFEIRRLIGHSDFSPKRWLVVGDKYPFFSLNNFVALHYPGSKIRRFSDIETLPSNIGDQDILFAPLDKTKEILNKGLVLLMSYDSRNLGVYTQRGSEKLSFNKNFTEWKIPRHTEDEKKAALKILRPFKK